jgi:carbamoylphosphate synthase large subunit
VTPNYKETIMGLYQNIIRWMQEKPEVITYLMYLYSPDALPDWVGKFKVKVDYAEILRNEGIELPAMVDDASASEDDDRVNAEEEDAGDVQEGTPAQASTIGATNFSTQTDAEGRGATETNARRRRRRRDADDDAEARGNDADMNAEDDAETRQEALKDADTDAAETQKKTVMRRISKAPDPIVNPNPEVITPVIKKPQYTKRGMGGSVVLEEMDVEEARISHVV